MQNTIIAGNSVTNQGGAFNVADCNQTIFNNVTFANNIGEADACMSPFNDARKLLKMAMSAICSCCGLLRRSVQRDQVNERRVKNSAAPGLMMMMMMMMLG